MKKILKINSFILYILSILFFIKISYANDKFFIKDIYIEGLKNCLNNSVIKNIYNYKNSYIFNKDINNLINNIFRTNCFNDIKIYIKNKNILIIKLKENFIINKIKLSNNKLLDNKIIKEILIKNFLVTNNFFVESNVLKFIKEIKNLYNDNGKYNINIDYKTISNKDKIDLHLLFKEGNFTLIKDINISGNTKIKKDKILNILEFNKKIFYFMNNKNYIYKKSDLIKKLHNLQNFYRKLGYINFSIDKLNIKFNKDMSFVFINILINEGEQFIIDSYKINGNFEKNYLKELHNICNIKKNELYNNTKLNNIKFKIKNFFLNKGYKNPDININFIFNNKNKTLIINFNIKLGKRITVRNINIYGNKYTSDKTIRNIISHMEYSELNKEKILNDIDNLNKLKYFENINVYSKDIEINKNDVVDLIYNVKEIDFNKFNFSSNIRNKNLNFCFDLKNINWLGTGNSILFKFDLNNPEYNILLNISNPHYIINNYKINTTVSKKKYKFDDNFNNLIINNINISNILEIPLKKNFIMKYGILFFDNNIFYSNFGINTLRFFKKNGLFNNNIISYSLKKIKTPISMKYKDLLLFTELSFNNFNRINFPSEGIDFKMIINNSLPISDNGIYNICFKYDSFFEKDIKLNLIFNNKIQFLILNNFNKKEIPHYNYINTDCFLDKVRGFNEDYINEYNFEKIIIKNNKLIKVNKSNSQLILINEMFFPRISLNNNLKNIFECSLFLDHGINLSLKSNPSVYKKHNVKHNHISAGIGFKWFSPIGVLKISYSLPIKKCLNEKTKNLQVNFNN